MSEQKLCPFRAIVESNDYPARWVSFGPCLEDKCAMWRIVARCELAELANGPHKYGYVPVDRGHCSLAGKP